MRLFYLSCFFTFIIIIYLTLLVDEFSFHKINTSTTSKKNLYRRDDDNKQKHEENNNDKKSNSSNTRVTTEIDVIYTTVIIAATITPTPFVYNVSDTGNTAHQQEQPPTPGPTTSISNPNNQSSNLKNQATQDQQAISRMTLTLSLVGGLGVIAVVATLVIFTRLRARTRKQREIEEGGSTYELSGDIDPPNSSNSSNTSNNNNNNNTMTNETAETETASLSSQHTTTSSTSSSSVSIIEPSAPPALLMIGPNDSRYSLVQKNSTRHIISMSSQTTAIPSPSAPTAKELDAMVDENSHRRNSLHHHHHLPSTSTNTTNNCSRCIPSMIITPELPPPAYTPSAPPHYALPVEPIMIESPSNNNLPSRRHSLGG